MRILMFLVFTLAALWAGDRYFYNGRYFNGLWLDFKQEVQSANYEIQRRIRF
jgi:hypothetical protein